MVFIFYGLIGIVLLVGIGFMMYENALRKSRRMESAPGGGEEAVAAAK